MKKNKYLLVGLFFVFVTSSVFASPNLSKVPWSAIGEKIKTATFSNNTLLPTTMALRSNSDWIAAANLLTIPVYFYNPALGLAASSVLAYADSAPVDAVKAWNDGKFKGKAAFQSMMDGLFPPNTSSYPISNSAPGYTGTCGIVLPSPLSMSSSGFIKLENNDCGISATIMGSGFLTDLGGSHSPIIATEYHKWWASSNNVIYVADAVNTYRWTGGYSTWLGGDINTSPGNGPPDVMPSNKIDPFLEALKDIMNNRNNPNLPAQEEITALLPEYTPPVPGIPTQSVTNYNNAETTNNEIVNSQYNQTINDIVTNNPTSVEAKIEQAKALEMGSVSTPVLESNPLHELNFKPITDLKDALNNHFPFSVLSGLVNVLSQLSASPVTPEYIIDLKFYQASVDFQSWDNYMSGFRLIIGFIFVVFMGFRTVQIWR